MDKNLQVMFSLIRASLDGETVTLPAVTDFQAVYELAKRHNIVPLVFMGLDPEQLSLCPGNVADMLMQAACFVQIRQYEVGRLRERLEAQHIDFMLLKGSSIIGLYPQPQMRLMGDIDILPRAGEYERIGGLLTELGYQKRNETDHDFEWKSDRMNLELHKYLFSKSNADFYSYFSNVWEIARPKSEGSSEYVLSDEDNYLYLFAHFTKHYRIGGIGFKHLIDLYVFRKAKRLDTDYLNRCLQRLRLDVFHENICSVLECCFEGREQTEKDAFLLREIAACGSFGERKNEPIARALQRSYKTGFGARLSFIFRHVFPPYRVMKQQFPFVQRIPVALPAAWVIRIPNLLLNKRHIVKKQFGAIHSLSSDALSARKEQLNYVGLDFDNKK